jgi:hypothetical protein
LLFNVKRIEGGYLKLKKCSVMDGKKTKGLVVQLLVHSFLKQLRCFLFHFHVLEISLRFAVGYRSARQ